MAGELKETLPFEVVKVSMSQTKDGVKLVLAIHPHDNAADVAELFAHPIGSRYMAALVKLQENEQPEPRPMTDGERAVQAAGFMCREQAFQEWLLKMGYALSSSEDDAVHTIHRLCGIQSRAELATNNKAMAIFDHIINCYHEDLPLK